MFMCKLCSKIISFVCYIWALGFLCSHKKFPAAQTVVKAYRKPHKAVVERKSISFQTKLLRVWGKDFMGGGKKETYCFIEFYCCWKLCFFSSIFSKETLMLTVKRKANYYCREGVDYTKWTISHTSSESWKDGGAYRIVERRRAWWTFRANKLLRHMKVFSVTKTKSSVFSPNTRLSGSTKRNELREFFFSISGLRLDSTWSVVHFV